MEPDSIDFPLYYNVSPFYPLLVALGALGGLAGMSVYFWLFDVLSGICLGSKLSGK